MKVRVDKWLWAARFFKTRSLAAKMVSGGKVHCNGSKVKPSRELNVGDKLTVQKGDYEYIVVVEALNDKRRPAKEAVLLYQETEESILHREEKQSDKRIRNEYMQKFSPAKRPSKRDRRLIRSFTRQD
jgi:ribosome-associated heat shock protein Hsp15